MLLAFQVTCVMVEILSHLAFAISLLSFSMSTPGTAFAPSWVPAKGEEQ